MGSPISVEQVAKMFVFEYYKTDGPQGVDLC